MRKVSLAAVVAVLVVATMVLTAPRWGSRIGSWRVPDQTSAEMQAEATRVAGLAAQQGRPKNANCAVKVLRVEAATTWAWASCRGWQASDDGWGEAGWSAPIRVDGQVIVLPEDGANYPRSIAKMMPWDLRHLVLRRPAAAQPAEPELPAKPA